MHTIHFYISVLIVPKPRLCIKKYSVQVFRVEGKYLFCIREGEASFLRRNSLVNTTLLAPKRYAASKGIVASKHYSGKQGFAGIQGGSTTP